MVAALHRLDFFLILFILLLEDTMLWHFCCHTLYLLTKLANLRWLLAKDSTELLTLLVSSNDISLKGSDRWFQSHVGVLKTLVFASALIKFQDEFFHLCHIFYKFLFDALIDIFGVGQSLQAFSELVELTNSKLDFGIDSVELLCHVR